MCNTTLEIGNLLAIAILEFSEGMSIQPTPNKNVGLSVYTYMLGNITCVKTENAQKSIRLSNE